MRMRMINPAIWDDSDFGSLSVPSRLLFIGLISHADDEGRGIADPRQLRKQCFGFDEGINSDQVERMLNEIGEKIRNVKFYVNDGREYYCLLNWLRYQKISHPSPSTLPAPDGAPPPTPQVGGNGKSNVFKAYEENIGPLTANIAEMLKIAEGDYPESYILKSFEEAVRYNKRNWAYCKTIIDRWMVEGLGEGLGKPARQTKQAGNKSAISSVLKVN